MSAIVVQWLHTDPACDLMDLNSNWAVLLTRALYEARKLAGAPMLLYLGHDGAPGQQGGVRVFGRRGNPPAYNTVDRWVTDTGCYPLPSANTIARLLVRTHIRAGQLYSRALEFYAISLH